MQNWKRTTGELLAAMLITVVSMLALSACTPSTGATGPPGPAGPAGVGVTGATVNNSGHLVLSLSDGKTIDAGGVSGPQVTVTQPPGSTIPTMADVFSQIQPVVVRIDDSGLGFQASGSGVIIRNDGYVITNQHVIENATSIMVTLSNDKQYAATITSSDTKLDLAILKLTGSPSNLPVVVLGSPSDIAIGGVVIASGFPIGLILPGPASFTQGIVSAIRTFEGQKYIQTDVTINPGSSGGALVNRTNAKLIGLTTAGLFPPGQDIEGLGLAIPIDVIQTFIQANLK